MCHSCPGAVSAPGGKARISMSKKQKTGGNRTAGIIKILIYAVLVLFCVFVFLLYGEKAAQH